MTQVQRRPRQTKAGFDVSASQVKQVREFNKTLRYVQGFRAAINAGTNQVQLSLNASGKMFLGLAVMPILAGDLSDTDASLVINNANLLQTVNVQNLNPNFVQGMIFYPVPQPLFGNDTINMSFVKNNAGTVITYINVYYVPRLEE